MTDAEVIEAVARAMLTKQMRAVLNAAGLELEEGQDAFMQKFAALAHSVCAPAIRERCAAVAEAYDDGEEYEANGYFIAERIRALPLPTPHDGLTDTSHHAGSSAGESDYEQIVAHMKWAAETDIEIQLERYLVNTSMPIDTGVFDKALTTIRKLRARLSAPSGGEMVMVPREPTEADVERLARKLVEQRGVNPDALYQHHEWEDYLTDERIERKDVFNGEPRVLLMHRAWRGRAKDAREILAMLAAASPAPPHQGGISAGESEWRHRKCADGAPPCNDHLCQPVCRWLTTHEGDTK